MAGHSQNATLPQINIDTLLLPDIVLWCFQIDVVRVKRGRRVSMRFARAQQGEVI
jgi:hypothetical protein